MPTSIVWEALKGMMAEMPLKAVLGAISADLRLARDPRYLQHRHG